MSLVWPSVPPRPLPDMLTDSRKIAHWVPDTGKSPPKVQRGSRVHIGRAPDGPIAMIVDLWVAVVDLDNVSPFYASFIGNEYLKASLVAAVKR